MKNLLIQFEQNQINKRQHNINIQNINIGNVIRIHILNKINNRIYIHEGYVISKKNKSINSSIKIKKYNCIFSFFIYSPSILKIEILKHNITKRAKLNNLNIKIRPKK